MSAGSSLARSVGNAHEQALVALTDRDGDPADAIAWLSAHLAAAEDALYPEIRRALPVSPATLDLQRDTHQLLLRLQVLAQVCAEDPVPVRPSLETARDDVVDALVNHLAAEDILIADLLTHLSAEDAERVAAGYEAAFRRGPTGARAVAVAPALRRPAKRPGRWGRYRLRASGNPTGRPAGRGADSSDPR